MDEQNLIYRDLQQHLDKGPVGYPATESGVDIRLLRHLFTPEEARIATCLQIGSDHAHQYVEMGIARYVEKDEAFAILDRAREAGFILQPENSRRPEAICCCCGDCCGLLSAVIKSPRPADLYASNYFAEVDTTVCKGCGICVKRCQLQSRSIIDGVVVVDLNRCIGCGNCVVTCESGASRLRTKENTSIPPKDKDTTFMKILAGKVGRWNMLKIRLKMLLGMRV